MPFPRRLKAGARSRQGGGGPTLDDNFPDVPEPLAHTTPRLREELVARGILPDPSDRTFGAMTGGEAVSGIAF